jgi:4-hydroxy-tetrahydrodipicolinate synthase
MARLAEIEQVVGVKEACGDIVQISEVVAACPPGFSVLSGDDAMTLALMAVGGRGLIATSANVAPAQMLALVRAAAAGDFSRARAIHYELLPLFDVLFCETNPIPVKAAVAMLGLCGDEVRLPLTPLTEASRERLQGVLKELGIL